MGEFIELIQIFIDDDKRKLCHFVNQLMWVVGPALLKWRTDEVVMAGFIRSRCDPAVYRSTRRAVERRGRSTLAAGQAEGEGRQDTFPGLALWRA